MNWKHWILLALTMVFLGCHQRGESLPDYQERAKELAQKFILVDTHIDVPYRLWRNFEDVSRATEKGNFDYPRARAGGLNVAFMSIYIPATYQGTPRARLLADSLINMVEQLVQDHPDKFALATSVEQVRQQFARGLLSLAMGMENGAPIQSLQDVRYFYQRGIRYVTLTHARDNHICDSSYDSTHTWNGLSPFGEQVVQELNRVGIMVDVSHVSDSAFYDVLRVTRAPVIASHSSCRHFTPGWERNMSDEMIRALAENGGVIQINFGSSFISNRFRLAWEARRDSVRKFMRQHQLSFQDSLVQQYIRQLNQRHPLPYATVSDVADHIDHVVQLVGIDHVGLGSDFDGVGDSLPIGLKDVSQYPNLIAELLSRGYHEEQIRKICGENLLRVWQQVEQIARQLQQAE